MNERLHEFAVAVASAISADKGEAATLSAVRSEMQRLVAVDDWLAPEFALAHPEYYQQYLLYLDPDRRFSVVSFVWGPGQSTPIHDHTVWGVIGMLRGSEVSVPYTLVDGIPQRRSTDVVLRPGQVEAVSPSIGDIHQVRNESRSEVAISIHCYGADIGRVNRHVFVPGSREVKSFVSGYAQAGASV